jgi:hypothetical protein
MIYTTDLDTLEIWNGTAWRITSAAAVTSGSVLQTVQGSSATLVSTTSGTYVDTGLTATITPQSTSSKILVVISQYLYTDTAATGLAVGLHRNGTLLNAWGGIAYGFASAMVGQFTTNYLDSPASTSALTYKTQFKRDVGSGILYAQVNTNLATITLMEVSA